MSSAVDVVPIPSNMTTLTFNGRAPGEPFAYQVVSRAMVWGPHEVGGAEPRAERLSK